MVFVRQTGTSRTKPSTLSDPYGNSRFAVRNHSGAMHYIGEGPVCGAVQSAVMYILSSENEKKESSHTTT